MRIKLIVSNLNGVWTDGCVYYGPTGSKLKRFNTYDNMGVTFAHQLGIPVCIMSDDDKSINESYTSENKIDYLYQGVDNKFEKLNELCRQLGINLSDVAYIGDSFTDYRSMQAVGVSGAPASAPKYIKKMSDVVLKKKGGEGAFCEFVEYIVEEIEKVRIEILLGRLMKD